MSKLVSTKIGVIEMENIFKKFKLDGRYSFNYIGNGFFGTKKIYPDEFDNYLIEINGKLETVNKSWIGLICHFEVDLPFEEMRKISFVDFNSNLHRMRCGKMMVIDEPIDLGYLTNELGYRVIPGFPFFVINRNGDILSLKTGRPLSENINAYGYRCVNLYDPDKTAWRHVNKHMCLARAFIKNNNIDKYYSVNHKDGNKLNNSLDNLEWCTIGENTDHAKDNGLYNLDKRCSARDLDTGEIIKFNSIREAMLYIGYGNSNCISLYRNDNGYIIPKIFYSKKLSKKFEIKLDSENRDWYYRIIVKDKPLSGPFQSKNISTGDILEFNDIMEMSKKLNIPYMRLNRVLNSNENLSVDGYLIRVKSNEPWVTDFRPVMESNLFKRKKYTIRNKDTSEVTVLNSGRELMRYLKCSKTSLRRLVEIGAEINGYIIESIEDVYSK